MNIIAKIGLLFIIIGTTSCESFLEEDPNTFISQTNFYQTESDARTACDGIYKLLNDGGAVSLYGRFWPAIDVATDDVSSKVGRTNFNPWFEHTINGKGANAFDRVQNIRADSHGITNARKETQ